MTDTASSVEIEDVLASVRRLVSIERGESRPTLARAADHDDDEAEGKLILTADLRVPRDAQEGREEDFDAEDRQEDEDLRRLSGASPETVQQEAAQAQDLEPMPILSLYGHDGSATDHPDDTGDDMDAFEGQGPTADSPAAAGRGTLLLTLEERIAQLEAAVSSHTGADFEPDGSEDQRQHRPESMPLRSAMDEERGSRGPATDKVDPGSEGVLPQDDDTTADDASDAGAQGALFVRAAVLHREQRSDLPDGQALAGAGAEDSDEDDLDLDALAAAVDRAAGSSGADDDRGAPGETAMASASGGEEGSEPDEDETPDDFAPADGTAVPFPFSGHRAGNPQRDADMAEDISYDDWEEDADELPEAGMDIGDDAFEIDEEMLRDMVAEIVREELQGALGERITRNVRKLVRREIMRALAIREFE